MSDSMGAQTLRMPGQIAGLITRTDRLSTVPQCLLDMKSAITKEL